MTQTVSAQDARNKFAEILNTAVYGKKNVIITRFDKPQAVLMDYKEYERLMNPAKRFTQEEWEEGFEVFDEIRANNKNVPAKEIEGEVDKTVVEVRSAKRVARSR